ncbi:hypothetical protein MMG00_10145 [Ignatzschineria rhizosphaerae]|uniref:Lipocalin-like domain-containing protein n=1 Tax=Ignatzschineria rhizosphaerae TaxID=2923279 RepID=A0ABY3WY90_9GAMM|nr:hypothetical protein [Ignatzschineria rhizosphaerae]UNM95577.1 hypothetical protein MMG00_10145 [Ignatzschineria rhizosphaerae]
MKFLQKSFLICLSLLVISCATVDNNSGTKNTRIAESVTANQVLGPWAVIGSNRAPQELTNVSVLFPNKTGLRYTNTIKKGTREESQKTELFTWTFDETNKLLTQHIYEKHINDAGKPRRVERKNITKKFHTELYKSNNGIVAVKLSNEQESAIYSKLDDRKLEVLLKDNINVPALIR